MSFARMHAQEGGSMPGIGAFLSRFKRPHPGTRALGVAGEAAGTLLRKLDAWQSAGQVSQPVLPLYRSLLMGTGSLYGVIVANQPFTDQLLYIGFAGKSAALAGYIQLIYQRLWDVRLAFEADPEFPKAMGLTFGTFVNKVADFTDT